MAATHVEGLALVRVSLAMRKPCKTMPRTRMSSTGWVPVATKARTLGQAECLAPRPTFADAVFQVGWCLRFLQKKNTSDGLLPHQECIGSVGLGWVGLGQGLTWSPTRGLHRLPCTTRLGGRTRVSGHKAYRSVDHPQTPQWRSRAGDAAMPVCMCPCVSEGRGGGGVCASCSRPRQGGWRA